MVFILRLDTDFFSTPKQIYNMTFYEKGKQANLAYRTVACRNLSMFVFALGAVVNLDWIHLQNPLFELSEDYCQIKAQHSRVNSSFSNRFERWGRIFLLSAAGCIHGPSHMLFSLPYCRSGEIGLRLKHLGKQNILTQSKEINPVWTLNAMILLTLEEMNFAAQWHIKRSMNYAIASVWSVPLPRRLLLIKISSHAWSSSPYTFLTIATSKYFLIELHDFISLIKAQLAWDVPSAYVFVYL